MTTVPEIDVRALAQARTEPHVLLDVREPDEYREAHVPGALLIPLGSLVERHVEIPDGELYVICRSGARSAQAVEWLSKQGRRGTNVTEGTLGWIEAGYEVVTGDEPS